MGSLVLLPGIEPVRPAVEVWSLNQLTARKVPPCPLLLDTSVAVMHDIDRIITYLLRALFVRHRAEGYPCIILI